MKYIRNYKSHRNQKDQKDQMVNEEFLGKLFKRAKSKLALEISKKLGGSAKKVKNIMGQYKEQLKQLLDEKNEKLKAVVELDKSRIEGGDVEEDMQKAIKANKKSDEVYDQKKKLMKEKFDLEFAKVVKEEKNEDIKHYIKIKKIELGEEMLEYEMNYINQEMGISEEDIKSSEMLTNLIKGKKEQMDKLKSMQAEMEKAGFGKKEERGYEPGDEITYTKKDGGENTGKIADDQEGVAEDMIRVVTDKAPNGFAIKKTQIKAEVEEETEEEEEQPGLD